MNTIEPEALPEEVDGLPVIAAAPLHAPIRAMLSAEAEGISERKMIPFAVAEEIFSRHQKHLEQIPGVQAVFLSLGGIAVYTDQPDLLPEELEDLPVTTFPPMPGEKVSP